MNTAPILFISHGAPTFALEPGQLGPRLQALGEQLSGVTAVLVVSLAPSRIDKEYLHEQFAKLHRPAAAKCSL